MRKEQVNKALPEPEKDVNLEVGGNKEYEVEAIIDSVIYSQQANSNQMLGLNYFVFWKG